MLLDCVRIDYAFLGSNMYIDDLAQQCAEQTDNYYHGQPSNSQYCYELFRLALEEGNSDAITYIRQIYDPQMLKKIRTNLRFLRSTESAEDIVHIAFVKFYLHVRGGKFLKYKDVAPLLKYWQMC